MKCVEAIKAYHAVATAGDPGHPWRISHDVKCTEGKVFNEASARRLSGTIARSLKESTEEARCTRAMSVNTIIGG